MNAFPREPVAPREFVEDIIPSLFAELEFDERAETLDLKLGLALTGGEGGEWTLHFVQGELGVAEGLAPDCSLTLVQSVTDWRAGLWEGRPGLVADMVELISKRGQRAGSPAGNPDALRELENLPGRIDAIIEGVGEPDWQIGVQIGPGPISRVANATIKIGAAEAESLRSGELHPIEALISGQLRLEGDLGLILQLQAIAMAASLPAQPRR